MVRGRITPAYLVFLTTVLTIDILLLKKIKESKILFYNNYSSAAYSTQNSLTFDPLFPCYELF